MSKSTQLNTLKKAERLKSRKKIEQTFSKGKVMQMFPLRMLYLLESADPYELQAGFTVSSRHFKKATDRNRLKRLMREAYRTTNNSLRQPEHALAIRLSIFFIFTGRELVDLELIKEKTGLLIGRLENILLNEVP